MNMAGLIQHMTKSHSQSPISKSAVRGSNLVDADGDESSRDGSSSEAEKIPKAPNVQAHTPFQLEKLSKKARKQGESLLQQMASKQQKRRRSKNRVEDESYVTAPSTSSRDDSSSSPSMNLPASSSLIADNVTVKTENVILFKASGSSPDKSTYCLVADGLGVQVKEERGSLSHQNTERRASVEYPDTNLVDARKRVPNVFLACAKSNHLYYASTEETSDPTPPSGSGSEGEDYVVVKAEQDDEDDDAATVRGVVNSEEEDDEDVDDGFDTRSNSTIDDDEISNPRMNYIRIDYSQLLRPCYVPIFRDEIAIRGKKKK